jgi:ABC-2 type transport system ATP-binding protein
MQRRLVLCMALLCDPEVLLLDEPTASLDPEGSLLVLEVLREAAARGACVLLASHHLQEVEQICARAVLLDRGRVRAEGTLDELLGTGESALLVHGLTEGGEAAVAEAVRSHGGRVVRTERRHEHLFALFRRLREAE